MTANFLPEKPSQHIYIFNHKRIVANFFQCFGCENGHLLCFFFLSWFVGAFAWGRVHLGRVVSIWNSFNGFFGVWIFYLGVKSGVFFISENGRWNCVNIAAGVLWIEDMQMFSAVNRGDLKIRFYLQNKKKTSATSTAMCLIFNLVEGVASTSWIVTYRPEIKNEVCLRTIQMQIKNK